MRGFTLLITGLLFAGAACSGNDDPPGDEPAAATKPPPAPAAAKRPSTDQREPDYREVEVRDGGKITGKVAFRGELPEDAVERYPIPGNSQACGRGFRELVTIDVQDGALRNSFVFIDGIREGKPWPDDFGHATIDQVDCKFVPAAQVARRGPIDVKNSDVVLHNVNAREVRGVDTGRIVMKSLFNVAQASRGELTQTLARTKTPFIAVVCEAHSFMAAHILVPGHPYAAVVGDDGSYVLDDVPPGTHTVKAWHPKLGLQERTVTVASGEPVEASFEFTP